MADTKINPVDATPNPSPALTDTFPVYSSGQASSSKFVDSLTQVKNLIYPATTGLAAVVTPATTDIIRVTQGGTEKQETSNQIRQSFLTDAEYDELKSSYPNEGWEFIEHCHDPNGAGIIQKTVGSSGSFFNTAAAGVGSPVAGFDGEGRLRVLTNTAYVNLFIGSHLFLGRGKAIFEARIYPILLESVKLVFGFGDTSVASDADQQNGCWQEYDPRVSGNWYYATAKSAARTRASTGVAHANSTVIKLRVEVAADRSQAEFFINGNSVRVETTNIPLSTTPLRCIASAYKISGGQSQNSDIHMDYVFSTCKYTTAN